jgi:hypothetical protein
MLDRYIEMDIETLLTIIGLVGSATLMVSSVFLH